MFHFSKPFNLLTLILCLVSPATIASSIDQAAENLSAFVNSLEDPSPGFAFVIATNEKTVLSHLQGLGNFSTGAPLSLDTPIYIASQTKAYMGLLASVLDRKNILKLDSTLADCWPNLQLPGELKAADWTLAQLLNHELPIRADVIVDLEAYVTELKFSDYPRYIVDYATTREKGFAYDNLGYNIYAAILHEQTGKSWHEWLEQVLFKPLAFKRTSTRTSDFPLKELSFNHTWVGESQGWITIPPKTDAQMQSSGGIVTSVEDMGRWLQLHLEAEDRGAGLLKQDFADAHRVKIETNALQRRPYGLPCHGYASGWNVCDFQQHEIFLHGGGYTGSRSIMAFSPTLNAGIAVFANSDNASGWLAAETMKVFFTLLIDEAEGKKLAAEVQTLLPNKFAELLQRRQKRHKESEEDSQWQGWQWTPSTSQLAAYVGLYRNADLPFDVRIELHADGLILFADGYRRHMRAAQRDKFALFQLPLDDLQPIYFQRNNNDEIVSLGLFEKDFVRVTSD